MSHALTLAHFPVPSTSGSIEAYIQAANRVPMLTEAEKRMIWSFTSPFPVVPRSAYSSARFRRESPLKGTPAPAVIPHSLIGSPFGWK